VRQLGGKPRNSGRRGQALIFVTLSLPVTFGVLGFVVDVGWSYFQKEAVYTAAQSAAMAAALDASANVANGCGAGTTNVPCQSDTACPATLHTDKPLEAGCLYAKQNGFVNGGNNSTQSVSMAAGTTGSPVAGVAAPSYWVTATVSENIPTLFSAVLNQMWMSVSAKSTAAVFGGGGGCIYALNPTMDGGINMSNGSLSSNCGIYVDSNNVKAIDTSNGSITTSGGAKTHIVGDCNNNGGCSEVSPAPLQGSPSVADPFASLAASSTVGMTTYSSAVNVNGGATVVIQPGIYTQLITANNGTLTFTHGIYDLQAGININGATVNDDGAGGEMLYITGGQFKITSGTVPVAPNSTALPRPNSLGRQWPSSSSETEGRHCAGRSARIHALILAFMTLLPEGASMARIVRIRSGGRNGLRTSGNRVLASTSN
jgi:hypothetical protein